MPFNNITINKSAHPFTIRATDAGQVNSATLDTAGLLTVTGPNGFSQSATPIAGTKVPSAGNAAQIENTYRIDGPFNTFTNGTYSVNLAGGIVADTESTPNTTPSGVIGTFDCSIFDQKVPEMKSGVSPAPIVVTESSSFSTRKGWSALDGINIITPGDALNDHTWTTFTGMANNSWIAIDRGFDITVSRVVIGTPDVSSGSFFASRYPQDFNVEYSSDGTNWSVALAVTGETGWSQGESRIKNFTAQTARHWRIFVIQNNGNAFTDICTLQLWGT